MNIHLGFTEGLSYIGKSWKGEKEGKKKSLATTYSSAANRSTIGAGGLNFRVRNGNGWVPSAMVTRLSFFLLHGTELSAAFGRTEWGKTSHTKQHRKVQLYGSGLYNNMVKPHE